MNKTKKFLIGSAVIGIGAVVMKCMYNSGRYSVLNDIEVLDIVDDGETKSVKLFIKNVLNNYDATQIHHIPIKNLESK